MKYNWQLDDWPHFNYKASEIEPCLWSIIEKSGRFKGMLDALDPSQSLETEIELLTREALKSSEIEGEILQRDQVMSSIQNHLGLGITPARIQDPRAEGMGQLMASLRTHWESPLNEKMLRAWHLMLMKEHHRTLMIGEWRNGPEPMRIVSGTIGDQKIHFEAPPAHEIPKEMDRFFAWLQSQKESSHQAPVQAAIAHLYFESIHPFEDGNGRIGRALSEKILTQSLSSGKVIGISTTLEAHRREYYDALKKAQQSNEVTDWVLWFCEEVLQALERGEQVIRFVIVKSKILNLLESHLNSRQKKCIERMLKEGPQGFSGGMTAKKYQAITQASKATATRDLIGLVKSGILQPQGEGRSTHYELRLWPVR